MLVLSRKMDESIRIGGEIVITLLEIKGDRVKIGINAPSEVTVHRQEIYETIQREKGKQMTYCHNRIAG